MSFLTAAALGSGILSGLGSRRSSNDAQSYMDQAAVQQALARQEIDRFKGLADQFAQYGQDRLSRYEQMFQPLEETINDYYMNLNPDDYAGQANQAAQQQYQNAMKQLEADMAAKGLSTSGIGTQMQYDLGNQMAMTKAQNIMDAPHVVAQQQQGWLQGYGAPQMNNAWNQYAQGVGMQGNVTNMYQNNANMMSGVYQNQGNMANQNSMFQMGNMGDLLGLGMYTGMKQPQGGGQSTFQKWGWM